MDGQRSKPEVQDSKVKLSDITTKNQEKIKDVMIIKLEDGDNNCASCAILQYYSNKDTFISDVECIFCNAIISNQLKEKK